jgi:dihydroxyacetone kinase
MQHFYLPLILTATLKIAGALARRGAALDEVAHLAEYVASQIGTVGVGQEHVHASICYSSKQ